MPENAGLRVLRCMVLTFLALSLGGCERTPAGGCASLPLRAGLLPLDKLSAPLEAADLTSCFAMYSDLVGREPWPPRASWIQRLDVSLGRPLTHLGALKPAPLTSSGLVFHRDGRFTVAEVRASLEERFQSAGLLPKAKGTRYVCFASIAESERQSYPKRTSPQAQPPGD